MQTSKFVSETPSVDWALDIFSEKWATLRVADLMDRTKIEEQFLADTRPTDSARHLGKNGRLDGMTVLELGPLEAAHTFGLEQLGAKVTSIEGNSEAFLKCLIIKNALNLRSEFLLGSFEAFLRDNKLRYDMVFASGVLYHMSDPANLIESISEATKKVFFWTHYYDEANPGTREAVSVTKFGLDLTYFVSPNSGREVNGRWWGGLDDTAAWMRKEDIFSVCRACGFSNIKTIGELLPGTEVPACISFSCEA